MERKTKQNTHTKGENLISHKNYLNKKEIIISYSKH